MGRLPQRVVSDLPFENTYDLTVEQIRQLDEAEELMLKHDLSAAGAPVAEHVGVGP